MSEPWWYQGCLDNINKLGGKMCATNHCDTSIVKDYSEAYCNCTGAYPNGCAPPNQDKPNCCSYSATSPVPIISEGCYCCCGCLANDTAVWYSDTEHKPIVEYLVGDMVWVADNVDLSSFSQRRVMFSSGSPNGGHNTMIRVIFGTGADQDDLFVNRSQLFLLTDGTIKAATTLVPGVDELATMHGDARMVQALEVGTFKGGLHHIATSVGAATDPGGHLFVAKGVMVGDWALQMGLHTSADSIPIQTGHPEFGTEAYNQRYPHLDHSAFRSGVAGVESMAPELFYFEPFGHADGVIIPKDATRYLTPKQSASILAHGSTLPPSANAGRELLLYLFTLYSAFYDDINFYLDNEEQLPNAFAFEQYGQKHVVVTGGFIRNQAIGLEGMAVALGHCVSAFWAVDPVNKHGMSCRGSADFSAISGVIPNVWIGMSSRPIIESGIEQIDAFLNQMADRLKAGKPGNTCMMISVNCRLSAMKAAASMMLLPHCAGGPPDPALGVFGATATAGSPHGKVIVEFTLPVDESTATDLGAYGFDPHAMSYAAEMVSGSNTQVAITADVCQGNTYTVTVGGVLSMEGQPLKSDENSAVFTVT